MQYQVVFDVRDTRPAYEFVLVGLLFIAIGVVLALLRPRLPGWWGKQPRASSRFVACWIALSAFSTVVTLAIITLGGSYFRRAMTDHRTETIEGVVEEFTPMPAAGHAMERFCVQGRCFEYSDFVITGGFNKTSSHGGPIRLGLRVRLAVLNDTILRLEVANQ